MRGHFQTRSQLLLPFGATILKPGLYLYFGQVERFRQFHTFAHAQVLVHLETTRKRKYSTLSSIEDDYVYVHIRVRQIETEFPLQVLFG